MLQELLEATIADCIAMYLGLVDVGKRTPATHNAFNHKMDNSKREMQYTSLIE